MSKGRAAVLAAGVLVSCASLSCQRYYENFLFVPTVLVVLDPLRYACGIAYSAATIAYLRRHRRRVIREPPVYETHPAAADRALIARPRIEDGQHRVDVHADGVDADRRKHAEMTDVAVSEIEQP